MPRRFDQAFKDQIIQDRITNNMTIKEISMKHSISSSAINRWLREHRTTKKPKHESIDITPRISVSSSTDMKSSVMNIRYSTC
jgi:transposase-like protein